MRQPSLRMLALLFFAACASSSSEDLRPVDVTSPDGVATAADAESLDTSDAPDTATPPPDGIAGLLARVDPAGKSLFDQPFPTDLRRGADGRIDLSGFPNPTEALILDKYLAAAEADLDGFGITTPAYFTFEGAIDPKSLPTIEASAKTGSSVMVVNVQADSPEYGRLTPAEVTWLGPRGYLYLPDDTLLVQPLYGTPLREATTYAVVVFRTVTDDKGAPIGQPKVVSQGLAGQGPLGALYAPLRAWLDRGRITADKVAVATVFTTGTPTSELRKIAAWVDDGLPAPKLLDVAESTDKVAGFALWEGHYESPNLQFGDPPYLDEGGQVVFDGDAPVVQRTESLRFALAIPTTAMPAAGWPVVLYGHGTGGDYKSMLTASKVAVARDLTKRGFVVFGIDQPLHGPRAPAGTDPETASFNVFNPEAFRWNFRQSSVDVLVQARFAAEGLTFTGPGESPFKVDPTRLFFLGHSHGGLTGALMAPFGHRFRAIVLSGAGGGIAYTIRLRKDPLDFKQFLESILQISDPDELMIGHPVLTLFEALVDSSDPLTYAPYFRTPEDGGPPLDLILTSGMLDGYTPPIGTVNLAAAARMPIVGAVAMPSVAHDLLGIDPVARPVTGNVVNAAGAGTQALAQYPEDGHFAIFDNDKAGSLYMGFFTSALTADPPTIK